MKIKRILSMFVALAFVLPAFGCSSSQPAPTTAAPAPEATTAPASEVTTTPASEVTTTPAPTASETIADDYPNAPIHVIVPAAPGGAMETIFRMMQPYLEESLGQPLMIESAEGGSGVVGATVLAKSPADGYAIGVRAIGGFCNNWLLMGSEYGLDDFDYIGRFTQDPSAIFVHKDAPWNTLEEFIEYTKTQPEESVAIALANVTDIDFLYTKEMEKATGVVFNKVGYNGGSQSRLAVVNGEVSALVGGYFGAASIWEETKMLSVCLRGLDGIPGLEGVQTTTEALGVDFPNIDVGYMIMAPKGLFEQYPERAEKLVKAFQDTWSNPEFLQTYKEQGQEGYIQWITPEETYEAVKATNDFMEANLDSFN